MTDTAKALLRAGNWTAAEAAFRARLVKDDHDVRAMLGLSAVLRRKGELADARLMLENAVLIRPVEYHAGASSGALPHILRPRCIDAADYCAVRSTDGGYRTKYKGGHFSVRNLIERDCFGITIANLTGGDEAPLYSVSSPDIFINTIACPDRASASLNAVSRFLATQPCLPVINRPEAVALTSRDGNYERLGGIGGAIFPLTRRVAIDAPIAVVTKRIAQAGFALPVIVRATGRQTGRDLYLCHSQVELEQALQILSATGEIYIIAYQDGRGVDGCFRKARAFYIDGKVYPVAWLTSDHWQIHSGDRYRIMQKHPVLQAEEQRYLADPEAIIYLTTQRSRRITVAWRRTSQIQSSTTKPRRLRISRLRVGTAPLIADIAARSRSVA